MPARASSASSGATWRHGRALRPAADRRRRAAARRPRARGARLTLPHEQATSRRFVLIPLLELDFELATPDGRALADALAALPLDEGVRRAGDPLAVAARPA